MRVALYNSIPDIAGDKLASYAAFIKKEWDSMETDIQLELVVGDTYNPYGEDLDEYLGTGPKSFDLIEIDMARATELIGKVVLLENGNTDKKIDVERYINASVDAVRHEEKYLGFPTLSCGNFVIEIQNKDEIISHLDASNYEKFKNSVDKAQDKMVYNGACNTPRPPGKHARLFGGKITDAAGWYLPFLYLDAVIDIEKPDLPKQVKNVLAGNPNNKTIERLAKFFKHFEDNCGKLNQKDIQKNIVNGINAYFFGFAEKFSVILKEANYNGIKAKNIMTPPFGEANHDLVFNDALVLNKKKYDSGNQAYKDAMYKFSKFFTSKFLVARLYSIHF